MDVLRQRRARRSTGVGFLPIYLGPTLMAALWWLVLRKIIRISKQNRITSIADFIASRYGKSALLGGLVTVIAVIGIVPYIALQLKAVSNFVHGAAVGESMAAGAPDPPVFTDTALYVALILAAFTIVFGTRHLDATERHEGMVAAIAFESLVKLVAFLAVGFFVSYGMYDGFGDLFGRAQADPELPDCWCSAASTSYRSWLWLTCCRCSRSCSCRASSRWRSSRTSTSATSGPAIWLFPLYLLAINVFVLPIAFGGPAQLPARRGRRRHVRADAAAGRRQQARSRCSCSSADCPRPPAW